MKKKTANYTDEPVKFGKRVKDFLPSPDVLRKAPVHIIQTTDDAEEIVPVTIDVSKKLLAAIKENARKKRVNYQRMIVSILQKYSQTHIHK
jgi:predicted DNA binding CopG/RHH family protein